jgi:neutral ceramidase
MLRAGIARCSITPPIGMTMAGYAARDGVAEDKDDELYATSLILESEQTRIAIVALDLLFIQEPLVTSLRRLISQRIHVPPSNVLLNCSHTHCGPTSEGLKYDDDERHNLLRQAYSDRLQTEIPALAELALHRLALVRVGASRGEARIGINRRERQDDGSVMLGENSLGLVDHEVSVLRIDDVRGKPIAVVFAHGCHPVTMGPKCLRWSADYVEPARDLVEQNTGALSLFLQANAGDVNPITGIGPGEDNSNEKKRLGVTLGAEVLKAHSSIYTESLRGPRTLIGSLSKIPYYPRVSIEEKPEYPIAVSEEIVELSLQDFPDPLVADALFNKWDSEVATLLRDNVGGPPLNVAWVFRRWATVLRKAIRDQHRPVIKIPIQALRLGDIAIVGVPGETFSKQGMDVKRESPFTHTLFLGYSNGCVSYIPTPDAYPDHGWSVTDRYDVPDMIFQAYLLPTALSPDCGERVVKKSLDLLHGLYRQNAAWLSTNKRERKTEAKSELV